MHECHTSTSQAARHLFAYLCHPKHNWPWLHFRQRASEMEGAEQSGILPASTQHSWTKPLSAWMGLCVAWVCSGASPSELSHEARTVDTPWRRKRRAQAWVCASQEGREDWCYWKDTPKAGKRLCCPWLFPPPLFRDSLARYLPMIQSCYKQCALHPPLAIFKAQQPLTDYVCCNVTVNIFTDKLKCTILKIHLVQVGAAFCTNLQAAFSIYCVLSNRLKFAKVLI